MSRELINEMKKFIQITEGAWSLPDSDEDYSKLFDLLNTPYTAAELKERLYNVLGDDAVFDILDKIEDSDPNDTEMPAQAVIDWMQTQSRNPDSNHPEIWQEYVRVNKDHGVRESRECDCLDECTCAPKTEVKEEEENSDFMHEIQLESVVRDVLGEGPNLAHLVSKYQDDEGEFDAEALNDISDMFDDEPVAPAKKFGDDEDLDGLRFA